MLKADKGIPLRDRLIARPTLSGRLGTPVAPIANATMRNRIVADPAGAVHRHPPLGAGAEAGPGARCRRGRASTGCAGRPQPGARPHRRLLPRLRRELLRARHRRARREVLEHNGLEVIIPKQGCCGLPLQSNGIFPDARKYVRALAAQLAPYARAGHDIVATSTSCGLMLKREAHEILGVEDDDLAVVATARLRHLRVPPDAPRARRAAHRLLAGRDGGALPRALPAAGPRHRHAGPRPDGAGAGPRGAPGGRGLLRRRRDVRAEARRSTTSRWPWASRSSARCATSGAELSVCDSETCRWQISHATGLPSVHPIELLHRAYGLG